MSDEIPFSARGVRRADAVVVVLVLLVVEALLWRFFLVSSYYRAMFRPVAIAVLVVGLLALWQALRPRRGERRDGDRRQNDRRND